MCPRCEHLQVLAAAFGDDLDVAIGQIAHPSGEREIFGLVVGGEAEPNALHPAADDEVESRAVFLLWSSHTDSTFRMLCKKEEAGLFANPAFNNVGL